MNPCKYCGKEHNVGMVVIPSCVDVEFEKLHAELKSPPSDGHTVVDEIIGLLRVARGQRDSYDLQVTNTRSAYNALEKELAEAKKDRARVDWLEKTADVQIQIMSFKDGGYDVTYGLDEGESYDGETLRQALDAAIDRKETTI